MGKLDQIIARWEEAAEVDIDMDELEVLAEDTLPHWPNIKKNPRLIKAVMTLSKRTKERT